ncbi:MAG: uroporphyrinogen decarboxylase [Candidatus Binatia bacterium]
MAGNDKYGKNARRGFGGLRVVSFESRMGEQSRGLIEKAGGIALCAPSMCEVPLQDNTAALDFARDLVEERFAAVVFLTGVGTRYLFSAIEGSFDREGIVAALNNTTVVARGPKTRRALGNVGVRVAIEVPEPNTWREVIAAMSDGPNPINLAGSRVAVQEYGQSNHEFLEALRDRGAEVDSVPVYRWELPDNRGPLVEAIREIVAGNADVLLFTSSNQVRNLFKVASEAGLEGQLRTAASEAVVGSVGPICSQTIREFGIDVDIEPEHSKLGTLIHTAAQRAIEVLDSRRRVGDRPRMMIESASATADRLDLEDSVFMRACRCEPTERAPVWLMRQAGRYMREYREMRARVPFIELCKTPQLAAEVAVTAAERLGVDAAILFSDILLVVEPMGLGLTYAKGEGPSLSSPIRSGLDVGRLKEVRPEESLSFVFDAIRCTRANLRPQLPLIGFSGAPFTLASYIVEGGGARNYIHTKRLMYGDRGAWDAMMSLIARAVAAYLRAQVEAGAQALQLFDSWVGCLSRDDYETYVLPHTKAVLESLPPEVPVIHFGTNTGTLLDLQVAAGGSVLGVDHRVDLRDVCRRFPNVAIQGNLDPVTLFADRAFLRDACERILSRVAHRSGFIFNLGHGILPATPVDNVIALVEVVKEWSAGDAE